MSCRHLAPWGYPRLLRAYLKKRAARDSTRLGFPIRISQFPFLKHILGAFLYLFYQVWPFHLREALILVGYLMTFTLAAPAPVRATDLHLTIPLDQILQTPDKKSDLFVFEKVAAKPAAREEAKAAVGTISIEIAYAEYIPPKPPPPPPPPSAPYLWHSAYNNFPWGQCTWGVAAKRNVPWRGDAWSWYQNAAAMGYGVGGLPRVGAIMVSWESPIGHVALVNAVYANGSFQIYEMNNSALGGFGIYNFRTLFRGDIPLIGFIY